VKLHNKDDLRSSVGTLWTEEDLHCMMMDVFCADIAASLDKDARIQKMKTFHNWNKDWQQLSKGVGPRSDSIIEERLKLKKKFWGIKLIYSEKLFWIHSVEFLKKKGRMVITLLLSTSITRKYYFVGMYFNVFHYWSCVC
jgi:hypothetical protein